MIELNYNEHLKMVKAVNFMKCVFYHNTKVGKILDTGVNLIISIKSFRGSKSILSFPLDNFLSK